jgi:general secretion pathway protein D
MEYWSGTESELRSVQLGMRQIGVVSQGNSGAAPAGTTMPQIPSAPQAAPILAPQVTPAAVSPAVPAAPAVKEKPAVTVAPLTVSWQGPKQAKIGDKIILSLNAPSTKGVKMLALHAGFDPTVLKVVDIMEGDSLRRNKEPSKLTKTIDLEGGDIAVSMSGVGAVGQASVVTLIFEVLSAVPESSVSVSSITATGAGGEEIPFAIPDPHDLAVPQ